MDNNEKKDLSTKDFVALLVFAGMIIAILVGFFSFEDFLKAHTGTYYVRCEQCGNVIQCKDGEVFQMGVQNGNLSQDRQCNKASCNLHQNCNRDCQRRCQSDNSCNISEGCFVQQNYAGSYCNGQCSNRECISEVSTVEQNSN